MKRIVFVLSLAVLAACKMQAPSSDNPTVENVGSFTRSSPDATPPGVAQAIEGIRQAARNGDRQGLLSWISKDVTISYGTDDGHAIFVALWEDNNTDTYGRFLSTFDRLTQDGGAAVSPHEFLFPYYAEIETGDFDIYSLMRVASGKVRTTPDASSPDVVIGSAVSLLCVDLLCLTHRQEGWLEMRARDGRTFYANSDDLIPVANEYRMQFEKESDGKYRLGLLVTAD